MLTIEALSAFGADTREGLTRCMNNEAFYLRMVGMGLSDAGFDRLKSALEADDAKAAFEAAHALKGVMGNLSLTPIYEPVSALTELLRGANSCAGTQELAAQVFEAIEKARALQV